MTATHVFVVAAGFGKRVIPKVSPLQLSITPAGALSIAAGGYESAIVGPGHSVATAQATARDVADITPGPSWRAWWLQTHPYRVPLPRSWTAHLSGRTDPSAFDLVGPRDSMMFIQTPRRLPALEQMVAPGQQCIDKGFLAAGNEWIMVRYAHDDVSHLQRHVKVSIGELVAIVTLQCREDCFALVEPAQRALVDGMLPGDSEGV